MPGAFLGGQRNLSAEPTDALNSVLSMGNSTLASLRRNQPTCDGSVYGMRSLAPVLFAAHRRSDNDKVSPSPEVMYSFILAEICCAISGYLSATSVSSEDRA